MKRILKLIFVLFFAVFLITGCSGNVQLGGTVTYEDGTPLTVGSVVFSTNSFMASGNIDSQGKYRMGSLAVKDGLPKGTYKVYITGAEEELSMFLTYSLIDPKYDNYSSTPLTCDIPAPNNTFNITVPKNPKPRP